MRFILQWNVQLQSTKTKKKFKLFFTHWKVNTKRNINPTVLEIVSFERQSKNAEKMLQLLWAYRKRKTATFCVSKIKHFRNFSRNFHVFLQIPSSIFDLTPINYIYLERRHLAASIYTIFIIDYASSTQPWSVKLKIIILLFFRL